MNLVVLKGRIAKIESKSTQNGTALTQLTMAVDRDYKNANGEKETDFINCVAWNKTSEFLSKYFDKGDMLLITGEIRVRNYEGTDGKRKYVTEVFVNKVEFCGSKKDKQEESQDGFTILADDPDDLPF